ncbi:acetoacetate decarboxylase [Aulosira sp. FACHB-615]|uniref:acetoacetate decarboxylase n=1 Tax=Aulosira sp. FACHB-615 TaxID=2692777 RepID=UPI0016821D3B|nr:acetoacetate decarboxylase [Aulosira sp. FACHB-615]MBD2486114.1 acetoacetate decarboxylase [Aulosira sp. FACHB-615]
MQISLKANNSPNIVGNDEKFPTQYSHPRIRLGGDFFMWGFGMADFTWEDDQRVMVRQGDRNLCTLNYTQQSLAWRQRLTGSSFSVQGVDLLKFLAECEARLGLISSQLEIPGESPFAGIGLGQPFLTGRAEQMKLKVVHPEVVGQRASEVISR